jgi:hypothetical protein
MKNVALACVLALLCGCGCAVGKGEAKDISYFQTCWNHVKNNSNSSIKDN